MAAEATREGQGGKDVAEEERDVGGRRRRTAANLLLWDSRTEQKPQVRLSANTDAAVCIVQSFIGQYLAIKIFAEERLMNCII